MSDGELAAAEFAFGTLVEGKAQPWSSPFAAMRDFATSTTLRNTSQATFLVLARKASRLRASGPLSPWLHGVARRTCQKSKACGLVSIGLAGERRRPTRVMAVARLPDQDTHTLEESDVHEEIGRLPERYRTRIVLCYLEGLTQEQAAPLGCPIGTVGMPLMRARDRLPQPGSRGEVWRLA